MWYLIVLIPYLCTLTYFKLWSPLLRCFEPEALPVDPSVLLDIKKHKTITPHSTVEICILQCVTAVELTVNGTKSLVNQNIGATLSHGGVLLHNVR